MRRKLVSWGFYFLGVFFLGAGAIALQCDSACEDADEASGQWEVYGGPTGPFRMDSRVCKAALVAGIIDRNGGEVQLPFYGFCNTHWASPCKNTATFLKLR